MKQILCYGDSNTYGYIPENGERYAYGVRWTSLLSERLKPYGITVAEEGVCGRTTQYEDATRPGRNGLATLPSVLAKHPEADTAILMLGTNDCKTLYQATAEEIGAGIARLLDQFKAQNRFDTILLLSPIHLGEHVYEADYDPEFSDWSVPLSKALEPVYERIARQYGVSFLKASDYASPSSVDQEHLSVEGHRALADGIFRTLCNINEVRETVAS